MTGNKYLLDTNIVIEIFDGNREVADKVSALPTLYISSVALGELYIGINRVTNKSKHLKKLTDFLELCTILEVDATTAKFYGECMAHLYKKGKPVPTNDVWIAAVALQHKLTLISGDKHFSEIEHLKVKNW